MRGLFQAGCTAVAIACSVGSASAAAPPLESSALPPWTDPSDVPVPSWVTAVVPRAPPASREDPAVYSHPGGTPERRGSARSGVPLPLYAAARGAGCQGRWYLVGPLAWICSDVAELTDDDPTPPPPLAARPDGLPYRYAFAGRDGAYGYLDPARASDDAPDIELEPGFGVALVEERGVHGELWGRTRRNRWVALRELAVARPIAFHGEELDGKLDVAWVLPERASVYASAEGANGKAASTRVHFEAVRVLSEKASAHGGGAMIEVGPLHGEGPSGWMRAKDLGRPHGAEPPAEVTASPGAAHERWIDVELSSQTLTAYEGTRPVFATLVSTGIGPQGSPLGTPVGTHRIWVKLATSTMDNVDDEDLASSTTLRGGDEDAHRYSIEDVPWVQFFAKGVALHAAFWHRDFGHIHSHGCVNLAPLDAARLFGFTSPHLPSAWSAALPSVVEPGTIVRVR
jgi:hypothetical protein